MSKPASRCHLEPNRNLDRAIAEKRVIICVGPGGVGKTTISAVIALHAAMQGRRVLVCTVDPAKRLANSLGVSELGDEASEIALEEFAALGEQPKGSLSAMMLDMKHAFDRLVRDHAPDAKTRAEILDNRFYKYFSTSLAGTQEYSAMERLYELYETTDYELIVLDTPPTVHALDFLDAPNRLFEAIDSSAFDWLAKKSRIRVGLGIIKLGTGYVLKVLAKLTGADFLREFSAFIQSFSGMWEGFKRRAVRTKEILSGDDVAFFVISGADSVALEEARYLNERLIEEKIGVGGFVINRVHQSFVPQPVLCADPAELVGRLQAMGFVGDELGDMLALAQRLQTNAREFHVLANRDQAQLARLSRSVAPGTPIHKVPFFSTDIHSLVGLNRIRSELFGLSEELAPAQRIPGRL